MAENKIYNNKEQERRTVLDYITHLWILQEQTFEHQHDKRIYTVKTIKASRDFKEMYIVTTDGVRMPMEECLNDLEVTTEQLAKLNKNQLSKI